MAVNRGGGPVVLVTGASGGVGRGIALACARTGAEVWIAARREAEGRRVADEVGAAGGEGQFVTCDVADAASVSSAVAAVVDGSGRLDAVVHNSTSGLSPVPVDLPSMDLADVADHLAVSVRGLRLLAVAAHRHLRASSGSQIALTSEAGFEGKAKLAPYAAAKAAQRGMVRALAREWGPDGIRVNAVAPLASTEAMDRAFSLDPDLAARVLGRIPLGRLGDPTDDIGAAVVALLSDEMRFVTGATVMVDGGSCPIT